MDIDFGFKQGDIVHVKCDAIVNAANESLLGGGGVDGAIHKAAGERLREFCEKHIQIVGEDNVVDGWYARCKTGRAVITPSFDINTCKYIIHTVGPIWSGGWKGEFRSLAHCYYSCLDMALAWGCKSIAFPCISAGCYKFPPEQAADVAVRTVANWQRKHGNPLKVVFVPYTDESAELYDNTMKRWKERDEYMRKGLEKFRKEKTKCA